MRYWVGIPVLYIFEVRSNEVHNHGVELFRFKVGSRVLDIYVFVLNDGGSTTITDLAYTLSVVSMCLLLILWILVVFAGRRRTHP